MSKGKLLDFMVYYSGLDDRERMRVRDEFLERAGLSYPSWYAKMSSGSWKRLELLALGDICGERFVE